MCALYYTNPFSHFQQGAVRSRQIGWPCLRTDRKALEGSVKRTSAFMESQGEKAQFPANLGSLDRFEFRG